MCLNCKALDIVDTEDMKSKRNLICVFKSRLILAVNQMFFKVL